MQVGFVVGTDELVDTVSQLVAVSVLFKFMVVFSELVRGSGKASSAEIVPLLSSSNTLNASHNLSTCCSLDFLRESKNHPVIRKRYAVE